MIKRWLAVGLLCVCFGSAAKAETESDVAMRLVKQQLSPDQLDPVIDVMVNREIYVSPELKPSAQIFKDFFTELMTSDEFVKALTKINTDLFTLQELQEIEKMTALPIYKVHQEKLPEYLSRMNDLSVQIMLANQMTLVERIKEAQKSLPKKALPELEKKEFPTTSQAYTDESACPNYPVDALVGKWAGERVDEETGDINKWTNTRKADGTMLIAFSTVNDKGVVDSFTEEGLWSYSGCLYTAIIKKLDGKTVLFDEIYRVHEVTDTMMRYSSFRADLEFTALKVR